MTKKEHVIAQILVGSTKYNYYYEEENMKRVFKGVKINCRITLKELEELSHKSHEKKYCMLSNNYQKFACTIIKELTKIYAHKIRINENIFRKCLSKEEKDFIISEKCQKLHQ